MTMSSRGRRRKPGRSDGAIEHMGMMGFDRDDICRELKTLLKIYGEDGWWFIESDSYKVLIEALLEAQERGTQPQSGHENGNLLDAEPVNENVIAVPEAADAGPSHLHLLPSSSSVLKDTAQQSAAEDIQAEGGGRSEFVIHDNPPLSPPSPPINNFSSTAPIAHPHSRRKPCYGWIDEDDYDGEVEIMELLRAPSAFQDDGSIGMRHERKRKTRWDVYPDGM